MFITKKKHNEIVRNLEQEKKFYKSMYYHGVETLGYCLNDLLERIQIAYKEMELNWKHSK